MVNIFLDLDGTLLNSESGIVQSLQHAMTEVGGIEPTTAELRGMIGQSLPHIFANFLGHRGEIAQAINSYRQFYEEEAMFDATPYDGVFNMFDNFLATDTKLFIVTAKPYYYAAQIADHFGFSQAISYVFGSEMDGTRSDKTELLQFILDETGFDPAQCVMVGDREYDIRGAKNNDIRAVGVTYGFGEIEELRMAESDMLAGHPEELPEICFDLLGIEMN